MSTGRGQGGGVLVDGLCEDSEDYVCSALLKSSPNLLSDVAPHGLLTSGVRSRLKAAARWWFSSGALSLYRMARALALQEGVRKGCGRLIKMGSS